MQPDTKPAELLRGHRITPLQPGSQAWLRNVSASKVPAILGLSPWDSPFSMWHKMAGPYQPKPQTEAHARGHYLEPAIAAWWSDQRPSIAATPGACWAHADLSWYTASPDRLVYANDGDHPDAVLEIKTASDSTGWGKPGTDEVPIGYRAQVMAQLDVVGVEVAYVAVLLPYLTFAEYVIRYDATEATFIRERCAEFMASIDAGTPPALDSHQQTYETVRALHPEIEDVPCELEDDVAHAYIDTWHDLKHADEAHALARTRVLDQMGQCKKAVHKGLTLATRQAKGGGTPFLKNALKESA